MSDVFPGRGTGDAILWESVYMRFVPDVEKLRNFQMMSGHGNGRCSWDVFIGILTCLYSISYCACTVGCCVVQAWRDNYISTSAWVLRCSFLHHRAMRRPLNVERVTLSDFHAFLFYSHNHKFFIITLEVWESPRHERGITYDYFKINNVQR